MEIHEYPLISVIIPCYNLEKVIGKCIDSMIQQTYKNIEIIVVNDGSEDKSLDIIKKYSSSDGRIKIIDKKNGGPGSAYNRGMEKANGKFIYILDGDNYADENLLEKLYEQMIQHQVDIAVCGYYLDLYTDGDYTNIGYLQYQTITLNDRNDISKHILNMHKAFIWQSPCNKLYKASIIENMFFEENREYMMIVDSDFNMRMLNRINSVAVVDSPLVHYVQYDLLFRKQITSMWREKYEHSTIACEKRLYNHFSDYYQKNDANESRMTEIDNFFLGRFLKITQTLLLDSRLMSEEKGEEIEYIRNEITGLWKEDNITYKPYRLLYRLLLAKQWLILRSVLQCASYCQRYLPGVFKLMKAG